MMRHLDLLRCILIALERHPDAKMRYAPEIEGYDVALVAEHMKYLQEAGYIEGQIIDGMDDEPPDFIQTRITMSGHDFLDSIRDPEIWRQIKKGVADVGSWTLSFVAELAKGYIKAKASRLGLPLI